MRGEVSKYRYLLVILALVLVFYMSYRPHLYVEHPMPLHANEWRHLSETKMFLEGKVSYGNFVGLEIGFTIFLAFLKIIGFNFIKYHRFLAPVFACLGAFVLFNLIKRKTNFYTGLFAILFFAGIPSNLNIEGFTFFIPLTFAIPLIYLFVMLLTEGVEDNNTKKFTGAFLIALLTAFIHPMSLSFMIPIVIVYFLFNWKFVKKNKILILLSCLIPLIALPWAIWFLWKGSFLSTISFILNAFYFEWGYIGTVIEERNYFFPILYGWIPIALAMAGVFFAVNNKKMKIFLIWILTVIILIIFHTLFKFTLFANYQRLLNYVMLGLAPLSAIGAYGILEFGFKSLKRKLDKRIIITIIVILISLLSIDILYGFSKDNFQAYRFYSSIDDYDYDAYQYLDDFNSTLVLLQRRRSYAFQFLTKHDSVACTPPGTNYCNLNPDSYKVNQFFYNETLNCKEKKDIVNNLNAEFIVSPANITCMWAKEIYRNKKIYVYEFIN